jgi:signal transduction histidine kinase
VDSYGKIISFGITMEKDTQHPVVGKMISPPEVAEKESFSLIAHKMLAGEQGVGKFRIEHINHITGFAPVYFKSGFVDNRSSDYVPNPRIFMGFGRYIHESDIKQHAKTTQTTIILLFVLMAIILISLGAVGYVVMRHVAGEVDRLNQVKMESVRSAAGGAAHSINQPLTGIFGFVAILQSAIQQNPEGLPEKVSGIAEKILAAAEKIAKIVDGMKEIVEPQEENYLDGQQIVVYEETNKEEDSDEQDV